jgi:hypothetical protein
MTCIPTGLPVEAIQKGSRRQQLKLVEVNFESSRYVKTSDRVKDT